MLLRRIIINAAPRLATSTRNIHLTRTLNMPSMPQNILKAGSDEKLTLKTPSLLRTDVAFIDGAWVKADSGKTFDVLNKATHARIGTVPDMGAAETRRAIDAAAAAFPVWSKYTAKQRADLIRALFLKLEEHVEDLAHIIVAENGKVLAEAKGEMAYGNSFFEWAAGEALRLNGQTIPGVIPGVRNTVHKVPVGVVGLITPWNFSMTMVSRKAAPALATGCTMVIKAPTETPFSALALATLAEEVGIPKGVINVITCSKGDNEAAVGKELCENKTVKKISFTGSTRIGCLLMSQCSGTLKKLSFELGGNAPFIVFGDADLDEAVKGALACKFRGTGQTCVCANRIYVHESVYAEFSSKLAAEVEKFKVGYGMDDGVTHGPLVNQAGVDKVDDHVQRSVKAGAKVLVGGKRGEGFFYEPTILVDLPEKVPMDDEETFGPLAALYKFSTEEEVIKKANDVDVGLAGYFYSQDVKRCWRVAEALNVGMVGINCGVISQNVVPFGGVGMSGFGREGATQGTNEYLVDKLMVWAA